MTAVMRIDNGPLLLSPVSPTQLLCYVVFVIEYSGLGTR